MAAKAAPEVRLGPTDVVVLDVRETGARAAAHIAATAARAHATLVVVGQIDPPAPERMREQGRGY